MRRSSPGHYPDVGRRVAQCRCEHAVAWRGEDEMRRLGWSSFWRPGLGGAMVRHWTCASCSVSATAPAPPRLVPAPAAPPNKPVANAENPLGIAPLKLLASKAAVTLPFAS